MRSERFDFPNATGERLAALLDRPSGEPAAYALFAHCFTCGKDILAAKRIAERLTASGIAVLRFDFTGLGTSEGEFANTTFSSNVADLVAAADHLRRTHRAPGHPDRAQSRRRGGAGRRRRDAGSARRGDDRGAVPIPAMSTAPVQGPDRRHPPAGRGRGDARRPAVPHPARIPRRRRRAAADSSASRRLRKALLIFHAPTDQTVGIENASHIFTAAKHPKSFVSLDDADHLLSRRSDAVYVANVIAAWAERYLEMAPTAQARGRAEPGTVMVDRDASGPLPAGDHGRARIASSPTSRSQAGGLDSGPESVRSAARRRSAPAPP